VSKRPRNELARFRAPFEEFEAAQVDNKIAQDARPEGLIQLAEQAIADFRQGRAREL
jgi:hypothetical protein